MRVGVHGAVILAIGVLSPPLRIASALLILGCAHVAWGLGDVHVGVADGKLSILGDDGPNFIQITPGVGTGAFVVTGVDGTAVNGAALVTVTDVRKMNIDMKAGQDRVELLQVDLEQTLSAKLGPDQDAFLFDGGRVKGKAEIKGGKDADELTVRGGARIGGKLVFETGKKNDTITVNNASIGGGLRISSGGGNDQITVQFSTLDEAEEALIQAGDGADRVDLLSVNFEDDFELDLGDGDDDVFVEDSDFDAEIFADGGDGDDELSLRGNNSFDLTERRRVIDFEEFD
jgi:hypothetical protein